LHVNVVFGLESGNPERLNNYIIAKIQTSL